MISASVVPTTASGAASLLDALAGPARDELLAIAQPVSFIKGAVLLRQGAPTRGAFLLHTGTADATVRLPGGETLVVAHIPAGGVIGEMSLLDHGICSATVTAQTPIDGAFIARDDFRVLVARRSEAALAVQHLISRNLCAKLSNLNAQLLKLPAPEDLTLTPPATEDPLQCVARTRAPSFNYRAFLPVLPLFADWEAEAIDELADMAQVLEIPRGQALFFEGADPKAAFISLRGAIEIAAPCASGEEPARLRRLAILGPGQLIGYRSMIDAMPHAARARACEAALLMELPRRLFHSLYHGTSPAALRLQAVVHGALLRSMAHTNLTLTRLVNLARLETAHRTQLQAALAEQVMYAS